MTGNGCAAQREFRIWVNGRLSEHFAAGLTGVDQRDEADGTVLSGDYVDESHLQGVLDRLRNLGIGVRRFEVEDAGPPAGAGQPGVPPEEPEHRHDRTHPDRTDRYTGRRPDAIEQE